MPKKWLRYEFCQAMQLAQQNSKRSQFSGILKESKRHPSGKKIFMPRQTAAASKEFKYSILVL